MSLEPLVNLMDDLARGTWCKLERSQALGMPLGENTLTDSHLLDLADLATTANLPIRIIPVTQNAERRLGADFEFWLGLQTGQYLGYSLQAKKVVQGPKHLTYPQLSESGLPPAEFQYDTLLDHAADYGALAVHVLYNGWRLESRALHHEKPDPLVYGCAAILTSDLKRLREAGGRRKSNKATTFAGLSMPWSDLFRVPPQGRARNTVPGSPAGPGIVRPAISPTLEDATALVRSMYRPEWGDQIPRLQSQLPSYIQSAIEQTEAQLPNKPELPRFVAVIDFEGYGD